MTTIPPEIPPAPNSHTQQVREHMAAVRAVMARIPGFTHPAKGSRRRLNFHGKVSDQALEAIAMTIEASPALQAASQITAEELRDVMAFDHAHGSLANDLDVQSRGVRYTIASRRAAAVRLAMQAYKIAQSLNGPADRLVLVPHLDKIKAALRLKRRPARPEVPVTSTPAEPERGAA